MNAIKLKQRHCWFLLAGALGLVVLAVGTSRLYVHSFPQSSSVSAATYAHLTHSAENASIAIDPAADQQSQNLHLFYEYQIAQLQRMIAEDNEATAIAKRNAAQATADTAKLLSNSAVTAVTMDRSSNKGTATNSDYELLYTGQQSNGEWNARLKKNGQIYAVTPGKQLTDGAKVVAIDEVGVLLSQDNGASKELITFSGVMKLSSNQAIVDAPSS